MAGRAGNVVSYLMKILTTTLYFSLIVSLAAANTTLPPNQLGPQTIGSIIFGIVAAIVILMLIVAIIVLAFNLYFRYKKQRFDTARKQSEMLELKNATYLQRTGTTQAPANGSATQGNATGNGYHSYQNVTIEPLGAVATGIPVAEFPAYVQKNRHTDVFETEFESLKERNAELQTRAREAVNKPKNRYRNILPYDHSRVVLEVIDDDPFSDYINASYIKSYGKDRAYIASQGPNTASLPDFWRMVWQENVNVIVMLTNLVEGDRVKCNQYWPGEDETETYGKIKITQKNSQDRDYGVIRSFVVKMLLEKQREVTQIQFIKWPDKSVPKNAALLLRALKDVKNAHQARPTSSLLVHCSAGIGRTGVVIALDSVLERAKKTEKVDILGFVHSMRESRPNMVQTMEQYIFLHEAVLESLLNIDTRIPVSEFPSRLVKLKQKDPKTGQTQLSKEFSILAKLSSDPPALHIRTGSKAENKAKNRYANILPMERNRAMLQTHTQGGNYINASFVKEKDGRYFIVTQMPMPSTVVDFWSLVYDYKPTHIAMLNEHDRSDQSCTQYWPDGGAIQHGPFTISTTSTQKHVGMVLRTIQVQLGDSLDVHVVHQYQFLGWPGDQSVLNDRSEKLLLDLMEAIDASSTPSKPPKILVHCLNGIGRSGVFCTVKLCLTQIEDEGVVDVFQTVKALREDRMQMVPSEDEYLLCYDVINQALNRSEDDKKEEEEAEGPTGEQVAGQSYENHAFEEE